MNDSPLPAFGVCGWSGSGKTTLVVKIVRHFATRGLKVAVIKHDVHGIDADREGKDSDRIFRGGAGVVLFSPGQRVDRSHGSDVASLSVAVERLDAGHDLVLVEGYKAVNLARKVWLQREATEPCPTRVQGIHRVLGPDDDRTRIAIAVIEDWLEERTRTIPLCAGILFGGRSERMGQPKHLLTIRGTTWLEHIVATVRPFVQQVVLLGDGDVPASLRGVPVLPDVPERSGPIAGMLSAMRWRPDASWLFSACDLPLISAAAVDWLTKRRVAGAWAIMPRLAKTQVVEPLFALYEFRSGFLLERSRAPYDLARLPEVITPEPPEDLARAWSNVNTPQLMPNSFGLATHA